MLFHEMLLFEISKVWVINFIGSCVVLVSFNLYLSTQNVFKSCGSVRFFFHVVEGSLLCSQRLLKCSKTVKL